MSVDKAKEARKMPTLRICSDERFNVKACATFGKRGGPEGGEEEDGVGHGCVCGVSRAVRAAASRKLAKRHRTEQNGFFY